MTRSKALSIIEDAAANHGRDADALWSQIMKDLKMPHVHGNYAAYKKIKHTCDLVLDITDTEAGADEMAQALRDEVIDRAEDAMSVDAEVIEASYIWARGETSDIDLDTALTFGKYEGETLRWLFENDRDYANWMISEMAEDRPHLITFMAIEEDSRRDEEDGMFTYRRKDYDWLAT